MMRSGCSSVSIWLPQMWNSSVPHLHAADDAGEVVDIEVVLALAFLELDLTFFITSGKPPLSCFWKNGRLPCGTRTRLSGRLAMWGSMRSATAS